MKIDYLNSLKKLILTVGMISGLSMLSGCGSEIVHNLNESSTSDLIDYEEESENNNEYAKHSHLVIQIGNQTIIFRECEDEIDSISFDCAANLSNEYVRYYSYEVVDKNGEVIYSGKTLDKCTLEEISSEYEEEVTQMIENAAIEKGAILYRGLEK